jgi:hypothetical protein
MFTKMKLLALPALIAAAAVVAPAAQGASTKTCTTSGTPHKNFTTTNQQTSACNSNSDVGTTDVAVTNPGGHEPGGQQP